MQLIGTVFAVVLKCCSVRMNTLAEVKVHHNCNIIWTKETLGAN